jgi:hypothetical protein
MSTSTHRPIRSRKLLKSAARRAPRTQCELLERRTLLAVDFVAGPYTTPTDRADTTLGTMGGFAPIEPMIRVNPTDPANIAPTSHIGTRLSTDGGANFTATVNFANPPGTNTFNGDTDMAFDAAGRLYWVNMAGTGTSGISVSRINPTTGASFTTLNISNNSDDKPFIAADANPNSPFANNVYVVWSQFGTANTPVMFSRSTNQGVTFSAPIALTGAAENFAWPSDVGVAPNGDVYVAFHANGEGATAGRTLVRRSTDGGVTFAAATAAFAAGQSALSYNVQTSGGTTIPGTQFWTQGALQPWIMPDPARAGNVYVVTNDDPNNTYQNGDDGDVVFARSTDNGATWTRSTISSGPSNSFQLFPTASIDRFGNIVVAWYDNRRGLTNGAGRFLLDVMATYSTDGGLTWATEFRINDNAFDPDPGASVRFPGPPPTTRIGEYFGIDVFGGTAHVAWNGNTFSGGGTPIGQQVTYSNFAVSGSLTISGDDTGVTSDSITLRRIATNNAFIEVIVNGARQYAGLQEAITSATFNGLDGTDTLTVDFSNGNPLPSAGISFDGGTGGGDRLVLRGGSFTNEVYTVSGPASGTITLDGNTIGFSNLSPIDDTVTVTNFTMNASGGDDIINIVDGPLVEALATTQVNSGNGTFELINFRNKTNVTVDGGAGADTINVTSATLNTAGLSSLSVRGAAGDDTVNLRASAFVPISVDGGAHAGGDRLNIDGEALEFGFGGTSFTTATRQTVSYADIETVGLSSGVFISTGTISPNVVVDNAATLAGDATISGTMTALSGGTVAPGNNGPGILTVGGATFFAGSTYRVDLNGLTPGTQHDQLVVNGSVSLGGATLDATVGFGALPGEDLVIIRNDLADPVVGTFAQGSMATFNGIEFAIDYAFDADGDGNLNDVAMLRFGAALGPDPCDPSLTALFVSATTGDDEIRFIPATGNSRIEVLINGVSEGVFRPSIHGLLIGYGQSGHDVIRVEVPSREVIMYGNVGNDRIITGNSSGILFGNVGDDTCIGGSQSDILIGGRGADLLDGGNGGDILVAGFSPTYEANTTDARAALCSILDEWKRGQGGYAGRVDHITNGGGLNGSNVFNATTLFDDDEIDVLIGGNGRDWFFLNLTGGVALDVSDRAGNEVATDLS